MSGLNTLTPSRLVLAALSTSLLGACTTTHSGADTSDSDRADLADAAVPSGEQSAEEAGAAAPTGPADDMELEGDPPADSGAPTDNGAPGDSGAPSGANPSDSAAGGDTAADGAPPQADADSLDADATPPAGYTFATIVTRGSEEMLVGADEAQFGAQGTGLKLTGGSRVVENFSLSGDGTTLWVAVRNNGSDVAPEDLWEIWSLSTDGQDAQRSAFPVHDRMSLGAGSGGVTVRTDDLGSSAWLVVPINIGEGSNAIRGQEFYKATRGAGFVSAGTTEDVEDFDDLDLSSVTPHSTDDGTALMFNSGAGLWRVDVDSAFVPFRVTQLSDVFHNGGTAIDLEGLAISDNGGAWVTTAAFSEPNPAAAVVTGTIASETNVDFVNSSDSSLNQDFIGAHVSIDDAGETITYTGNWEGSDGRRSFVGERGGPVRELLIGDESKHAQAIGVSGDGRWLHIARESTAGVAETSYFEGVMEGSARVKSHTQAYGGAGLSEIEMSDDSAVLVAKTRTTNAIIGSSGFNGIWAVHRNLGGGGEFATLKRISFLVDTAGDGSVILRFDVDVPDALKDVYILPLKDGYIDPKLIHPSDEDPLFLAGNSQARPVDDEPGSFEYTFSLGGKADLLDDSFSLRLVVLHGPEGDDFSGNRAVFADIVLE